MAEHRITIDVELHEKLTAEQIKELQKTVHEAISAHERLGKTYKNLITTTQRHTQELVKQDRTWRGLVWTIVRAEIVYRGIMRIVNAVSDAFKDGVNTIEKHKMAVISLAAVETSHLGQVIKQQNLLATAYQVNKRRAEEVYKTVQLLAAQTPLTGEQLMNLTRAFVAYGQNVNLHSQKAREGILALANAIAVLTQGQRVNIQIFQEVRALLTGVGVQYSDVIRSVAQGNPVLMEQIKHWAKTGELIYHLSDILAGFKFAAKDVQYSLTGLITTFKSLFKLEIIEPAFKPFYDTLRRVLDDLIHRFFIVKEHSIELTEEGKKLRTALGDIAHVGERVVEVFAKLSEHWEAILKITKWVVAPIAGLKLMSKLFSGLGGLIVSLTGPMVNLIKKTSSLAGVVSRLAEEFTNLTKAVNGTLLVTMTYATILSKLKEVVIAVTTAIGSFISKFGKFFEFGAYATMIYFLVKAFANLNKEVKKFNVESDMSTSTAQQSLSEYATQLGYVKDKFDLIKDAMDNVDNILSSQISKTKQLNVETGELLGKLGIFKADTIAEATAKISEIDKTIAEDNEKIAEVTAKILDIKKQIAGVDEDRKKELLDELKVEEKQLDALKKQTVQLYGQRELLEAAKKYNEIEQQLKQKTTDKTKEYEDQLERINQLLATEATTVGKLSLQHQATIINLRKQLDLYNQRIRLIQTQQDIIHKVAQSQYITEAQRQALLNKEKQIQVDLNNVLEQRNKVISRMYKADADYISKILKIYEKLKSDTSEIDSEILKGLERVKEIEKLIKIVQKEKIVPIDINELRRLLEKAKKDLKELTEETILSPLGDVIKDQALEAKRWLDSMKNTLEELKREGIIDESEYHRLEKGIERIYSLMKTGLLDLIKNMMSGLKSAFTSFFEMLFNDIIKGHLRSFKDYLKALFNDVARAFAHSFATYLATVLMSVLGNILRNLILPATQQGASGSSQVAAGLMNVGFLGNVSRALDSYWMAPVSLAEWAYNKTGWEPLGNAALLGYEYPWASAGLMGFGTELLRTGDIGRSLFTGATTAIGYELFGPIGGLGGNILGDVISGVFGFGHKKHKKPQFHILEDLGTYTIPVEEWLTWDEQKLRSTFHFDIDHAKHEKETEAKIVKVYKQVVDGLVKDWMDFTKQMDEKFGLGWEEAFKKYELTFYEHNWKGKHIGEDIEQYLQVGLPKEMLTQFVDFVAEQMKGYVADAEKFNQAIQSYKEAIQNASSQEELQQIYEQFKADIGTVLQMIDSVSNYMKYYLGETGQAVLGIIQQAEATWQTLEDAGLLTDELKQKIVEKAETDIALYLNQQLGLYKDWELQIARFKHLYGDVAQLIEQAGLSWRDLYNILTHVDQYMDVLQKIAEEHGITIEQLIAELAEYDVALKKQADAVREAAEASYSFASSLQGLVSSFARAGVFSPAESSYGMAWILAQELAAAMQLLPEGQPHSWAEFGVADPVRWLQEHMNAQTVKAVFDWLVSVYGDVTKIPSIWFDVLQQWSDYIANMQEEQKRAAEEQRRQAEEATRKAEEERKRYLQELKRLYEDTRRELERWADVIKKVDQTILDVAGYGLTPPATFRLLQYQYQQLYTKALSGDPEAIQKFLSFTRTYMQAGLKMAATPEEVAKLKEKVLKDLWKIRRVAENRYEDIKKKLDDINSKLNNLNSINTTLSSMNTTMSYMYSNMYNMNTTISYMSDTQMTEMNDTLYDINENIKNIDTSGMANLMSYIMWGVNAEEAVNQQLYLTKNLEKLLWNVSETLSYLAWGVSAEESASRRLYLTSNLTSFLSPIKSLLESIKSSLDTIKSKVSDIRQYLAYGFTYNINNTYAIAEELATGLDIPMSPYANHLETGGIVDDPTLALIGEGDRAEAVIPLPFGPKTMDILFDELREMKAENRALLIENRRLRKELYRLNYEMLKESKKTNRVLGKWDAIGMPPQQPQPKEEVSA